MANNTTANTATWLFFGKEHLSRVSVIATGKDTRLRCVAANGGSLRQPLGDAIAFTRRRTVEDLWGFCRTCPFASVCLGGCNFTAHALFGRAGNNPYCHFRVKTLAADGVRERLVLREPAPGVPFDHARFEIVLEPFDAPDPTPLRRHDRLRVWRGLPPSGSSA